MSDTQELIQTAFGELDHTNDEHWTQDGLPRIDVIETLTGLKNLKRSDLTNANPEFVRGAQPPAEGEQPPAASISSQTKPEEDYDDTELTDLQRELKKAERELAAATQAVQDATLKRNLVRSRVDAIRERAAVEEAAVPQGVHIRRYLDSQNEVRRQKAEYARQLKEAGVDRLREFMPQLSPLDAAMRRKSGHGTQRPAPRAPGK